MKPATRRLEYTPDPNKFDLVTHLWDGQGHLVKKNPYRSYIINGTQYFERPVNSGNLWYDNNQPAGRMELEFNDKGHIVKKELKLDAPHKEYVAPLTGDAKIHYELEQERARNAALAAELAAIKKEAAAKTEPTEAKKAAPTLKKAGE